MKSEKSLKWALSCENEVLPGDGNVLSLEGSTGNPHDLSLCDSLVSIVSSNARLSRFLWFLSLG